MMNWLKRLFVMTLLWPLAVLSASPSMVGITIHIQGMTCSLCVTAINKALRSLPQVQYAKTSLKNSEVLVHVPNDYDTQILLTEIEKTGYQGKILSVQALTEEPHPSSL